MPRPIREQDAPCAASTVTAVPRDEAALALRNRDLGTRGTGDKLSLSDRGAAFVPARNVIEVTGGAVRSM